MIVSRPPTGAYTASPSGVKPGIDSPAATRRASAMDRASASARPASSRNASQERRQSPVTALRPAGVPGVGSVTSWRVQISSYACLSGS
ncbi:hypothetical protein GCM10010121_028420 [Streptomyces brasiliensis]|uniref:Uncharacterized protein n=1 Tax=Streptomyces brasiliensis TaxID=1954 RepID=A0A917KK83_9ACTN|nr:hypothetical protein GCM10010121_028420 [Streptomyces brasiliensis]